MLNITEFCEVCRDSDVQVVDLRRLDEREKEGVLEFAMHVPLEQFVGLNLKQTFGEECSGKKIIFHCKAGGRAARAAKMLREAGIENVDYVRGDFLEIKNNLG